MNAQSVRVVVVDDAKDSADTMAELLRMSGYEVWTSGNGKEALALVDKHAPQCVLFDVVMDNVGGDELCIRLRADHGDDIVLVAVTGCSEDDPRVRTSFALADHYFTKPLDPASLAKVLPPLA